MQITKHLDLIQGYYNYLTLGKFLEQIIKDNDLSKYAVDFPIATWDNTSFNISQSRTKQLLSEIYQNSDKKNLFGYITEISAFKGLFGVVRELVDNNEPFQQFLDKTLGKQKFPFDQIIRFCRNILVHAIDSNISISQDDFYNQKSRLQNQEKHRIIFNFKYSKFIKERKGSKDYGIYIKVDFSKLQNNQSFFNIIPLHQLYLLSELCYNLAKIFRHQIKTTNLTTQTKHSSYTKTHKPARTSSSRTSSKTTKTPKKPQNSKQSKPTTKPKKRNSRKPKTNTKPKQRPTKKQN